MNPPEYRIEGLADFSKVPDDRLEACLAEFAEAVRLHGAASLLQRLIQEAAGVEPKGMEFPLFVWIDDGKTEKTLRIVPEEVAS